MRFSLRRLERQAKWQIRRTGMLILGGTLIATALIFLLAALWMVLAAQVSPLIATLIFAALFMGAGLVVFAVIPAPPDDKSHLRSNAADAEHRRLSDRDLDTILNAFLFGIELYSRIRARDGRERNRRSRR